MGSILEKAPANENLKKEAAGSYVDECISNLLAIEEFSAQVIDHAENSLGQLASACSDIAVSFP